MNQQITAVVYALEFNRLDASDDVLDALEDIRQHSTGTLSDSDTLIFYVGMATAGDNNDRFKYDSNGDAFPHARHQEHIKEPYQASTKHLHSKQAIKILDDAGIAWSCRVLEQYTDQADSIHEEMYRLKYIAADMPIMNTISGLSALPDHAIDTLSKCSSIEDYKRTKRQLKIKPKDKTTQQNKIIWSTSISFTNTEQTFLINEFRKYLKDRFNDATGYAATLKRSMIEDTNTILFEQKAFDTRIINSSTIKKVITEIIQNDGYQSPVIIKDYDAMTIDEQMQWHLDRDDNQHETGAAMLNRLSRGR